MVYLFFSLRFQTQLRRTRPDLVEAVEKSITDAVTASGGRIITGHRRIVASFNEDAIGFWLNMLILIDDMLKTLENRSMELYGHIGVISRNVPEDDEFKLLRVLPLGGTGLWCDSPVRDALSSFMSFDAPLSRTENNPLAGGYSRIRAIKLLGEAAPNRTYPYRDRIEQILGQGAPRSAVLVGPEFIGKRDGLRRYSAALLRDVPPLTIRFGSGGSGLGCFVDALDSRMRSFLEEGMEPETRRELDSLSPLILRERLRDLYSTYVLQRGKRFLTLLLEAYAGAVERVGLKPILILENIQDAGVPAAELFMDVWSRPRGGAPRTGAFLVYGTFNAGVHPEGEKSLDSWNGLFARIIRLSPEDGILPETPALPRELWEILYTFFLLRRYFPGDLFPRLFAEEGQNPRIVSRALDMLIPLGIVDFAEDPQPRIPGFAGIPETIGGLRREAVCSFVRNRLLAWVDSGRYRPTFNLLKALAELGSFCSDALIRDALSGDIINGTYQGIEEAITTGCFGAVVGEPRLPSLLYMFRTQKALVHGQEAEIREAFADPAPEAVSFPDYRAQIFANRASYFFGIRDIPATLEAVKECMVMSQQQEGGKGFARAYRLFSLVNLSRQQLGDAIEYAAFAVEHAEGPERFEELAVTSYYAAGIHFLFGNISHAEQLARQAEEAASASGRLEWAERARFMTGRFLFESGRYQDALTIFEQLRDDYPYAPSLEMAQTLEAWIYRSDVFLRNPRIRKPGGMNGDAMLFEVEAMYLAGNYALAVKLADKLLAALPEGGFVFIEQPDWRSGFSQCELLLFPRREFLTRIIASYRALALCRLANDKRDHPNDAVREQALDSIRRVIRDDRRPGADPNDAFYFYAYYCVLQESGAAEVDMNTAISMAFKHLQSRASRIDDPEVKRSFLSRHHWNNAMGLAAKKHRLI
jgi:tetratricopeptide (TPR) repeat protein